MIGKDYGMDVCRDWMREHKVNWKGGVNNDKSFDTFCPTVGRN